MPSPSSRRCCRSAPRSRSPDRIARPFGASRTHARTVTSNRLPIRTDEWLGGKAALELDQETQVETSRSLISAQDRKSMVDVAHHVTHNRGQGSGCISQSQVRVLSHHRDRLQVHCVVVLGQQCKEIPCTEPIDRLVDFRGLMPDPVHKERHTDAPTCIVLWDLDHFERPTVHRGYQAVPGSRPASSRCCPTCGQFGRLQRHRVSVLAATGSPAGLTGACRPHAASSGRARR